MQTVRSELDALEKTCEALLKHALKMKYEIITEDSQVQGHIYPSLPPFPCHILI